MKNYIVKLKGTKKNNTPDIEAKLICDNKSQAFNFAYDFFENGKTNIVYGTEASGLSTIHRWMPDAEAMKKYAGKYKVHRTSVICK